MQTRPDETTPLIINSTKEKVEVTSEEKKAAAEELQKLIKILKDIKSKIPTYNNIRFKYRIAGTLSAVWSGVATLTPIAEIFKLQDQPFFSSEEWKRENEEAYYGELYDGFNHSCYELTGNNRSLDCFVPSPEFNSSASVQDMCNEIWNTFCSLPSYYHYGIEKGYLDGLYATIAPMALPALGTTYAVFWKWNNFETTVKKGFELDSVTEKFPHVFSKEFIKKLVEICDKYQLQISAYTNLIDLIPKLEAEVKKLQPKKTSLWSNLFYYITPTAKRYEAEPMQFLRMSV